jgi:hypothetical protein
MPKTTNHVNFSIISTVIYANIHQLNNFILIFRSLGMSLSFHRQEPYCLIWPGQVVLI